MLRAWSISCESRCTELEAKIRTTNEGDGHMATASDAEKTCVFCRMPTEIRYLKLDLCEICRDQIYDFMWVSLVQGLVAIIFSLGGLFFVVEEILLFSVLIFVKHHIPPAWQRDREGGE